MTKSIKTENESFHIVNVKTSRFLKTFVDRPLHHNTMIVFMYVLTYEFRVKYLFLKKRLEKLSSF